MSTAHATHTAPANPFKQPKGVWAVAFACVISFMGIGLVDPILPTLASKLHATPTQVELLFTSYLVITAVAMLVTGWVSSRIGAKRTLVVGLSLIVAFSALAGFSGSIGGIVGFRAGWGLGNALFIATSLAVIVGSASGGFGGAIILYEAALGVGIAIGPLLGGLLGSIGWQWPFFGVAGLMAIALVATLTLVEPTPKPDHKVPLSAALKALRFRKLRTLSLMALAYNWGFFTLLGYAPFPMGLSSLQLGLVFTGWGILVALFSVFGAPRLQQRFGTVRTLYASFFLMAIDLAVIATFTSSKPTLIVAVIASGIFVGTNNTLVTQAVMTGGEVERPTASAAYGFVRFIGGGLAPFAAGLLAAAVSVHVPFYLGAFALLVAIAILATGAKAVTAAERAEAEQTVTAPDDAVAFTPPVSALQTVGHTADFLTPVMGFRVLVAIGSTTTAGEAVDTAARIATQRDATISLVHIREVDIVGDAEVEPESADTAAGIVRSRLAVLEARGVRAEGHVLSHVGAHRDLGRVVAEQAAEWNADLVIVGPGGPRDGQSHALQQLWQLAPCAVLLVKQPALV
jgi:MFS family permease